MCVNSKCQCDECLENVTIIRSGESAYEVAKRRGFVGTEKQWLKSLRGVPGATGFIDGVPIDDIINGFSKQIQDKANVNDLFYLKPEWVKNYSPKTATKAIQTCIDTLYALGGGEVLLYNNVYEVTSIKLRKGVILKGINSTLKRVDNDIETSLGVLILNEEDAYSWKISGIKIDGNKDKNTLPKDGIHIIRENRPNVIYKFDTWGLIENIEVFNCLGVGITLGINCRETRIYNVDVHDNHKHGFEIMANDVWFSDCTSWRNGQHGWFINESNGDNRFVNCKGFYNTLNNLNVWKTKSLRFVACSFQESYQHGVYISQSKNMRLDAHFGSNGIGGKREFNQIVLDNCSGVEITGEFVDWHINYTDGGRTNRCILIKNNTSSLNINVLLKEDEIDMWRLLSLDPDSPNTYVSSKIICNGKDVLQANGTYYTSGSYVFTSTNTTEKIINMNSSNLVVGYDYNEFMKDFIDKANSRIMIPKSSLYHFDIQIELSGISPTNIASVILYRNRKGTETPIRSWRFFDSQTKNINIIVPADKDDQLFFKAKSSQTDMTVAITNLTIVSK